MSTKESDPLVPTVADHAHRIMRGALGMVPMVGSGLAEVFTAIFAEPLSKRRDDWIRQIAEDLDSLAVTGAAPSAEELARNEEFVSILVRASEAARGTHQRDKLDALRHAVLNVAVGTAPDEDLQLIFLNLVNQFTPWHLRILTVMSDPTAHGAEAFGRNRMTTTLGHFLEFVFPDLQGRRDFYDLIWSDLIRTGLVGNSSLHAMMSSTGHFADRTTALGRRFAEFIMAPPAQR